MATQGGPAQRVSVQNSGQVQGGAAIPITVVTDGRAVDGGPAQPIYLVTSGPVQGGPALPVVAAPYGARAVGGPAIPAYIVGGGYLPSAYDAKVLALNPIAYWPLDELTGTVINDRSGNNRNGVYSNVTLGQAGPGDGQPVASFNGTTSVGNVYSAALAAAFNGLEGTMAGWFRVSGAGVWTDGTTRRAVYFLVDASNRIGLFRPTANNEIDWLYVAGGTVETGAITSFSPTGWFHLALTWSKAADQVKFYVNGAQSGATATGLGTFAGALSVTQTNIGSLSAAPAQVWSGLEGRIAILGYAASAAQIASLAVAP